MKTTKQRRKERLKKTLDGRLSLHDERVEALREGTSYLAAFPTGTDITIEHVSDSGFTVIYKDTLFNILELCMGGGDDEEERQWNMSLASVINRLKELGYFEGINF